MINTKKRPVARDVAEQLSKQAPEGLRIAKVIRVQEGDFLGVGPYEKRVPSDGVAIYSSEVPRGQAQIMSHEQFEARLGDIVIEPEPIAGGVLEKNLLARVREGVARQCKGPALDDKARSWIKDSALGAIERFGPKSILEVSGEYDDPIAARVVERSLKECLGQMSDQAVVQSLGEGVDGARTTLVSIPRGLESEARQMIDSIHDSALDYLEVGGSINVQSASRQVSREAEEEQELAL